MDTLVERDQKAFMSRTIYLDASRALHPEPTGIEVYCLEISRALLALPEAKEHTWVLLTPGPPPPDHPLAKLPPYARWEVIPGQRFWTWWHLSRYLHWQRSRETNHKTVLFVPGHTLPFITPARTVITIHDLAFRHFPEAYGPLAAWRHNSELRRSARKATAIIVPSQATCADVKKAYHIGQDRITVIPHGLNHNWFKSSPLRAPTSQRRPPYFLAVGRLEGRKNTARTIQAYGQFRARSAQAPQLVLIGRRGYPWPPIEQALQSLPTAVRNDVILTGPVTQDALKGWLQSSLALVYPSLFEGFGLPILEAMAAGVPVITSHTSSMPEVAGEAALLVDPLSVRAIAEAMERLAADAQLRRELSMKGRSHVCRFTWQKAAEATLALLLGDERYE